MTTWEAFILGWQFSQTVQGHAHDARDVGRIMSCDFWPEGFSDLCSAIDWTGSKEVGIEQAMKAIRDRLDGITACEHGVTTGEWCPSCNEAYKAAMADPSNR